MTITFCGHGEMQYSDDIKKKLHEVTENLIIKGAKEFLLGGYGNFDILAARAVKNLKEKYPHIKSILVIPYPDRKYNTDIYDDSVYPPVEEVPKRIAIVKRNEWMVNKSDFVVAYVEKDFGGAARTVAYARKKKKGIVNLAQKTLKIPNFF